MVREALDKTVHRVKGVARERGRDLEPVVGLVKVLVEHLGVESPVSPIYHKLGEH